MITNPDASDMTAVRLAVIETHVGAIRTDIAEVKSDLKDVRERTIRIEEKIIHLPGKGFIVSALSAGIGLIMLLLTFQAQVQHWLGAAP